ncbi:lipid A export ATP-binding/permease protein MsbA [Paenibacillus baekrokdamisoli]|uniref:Lipid A export ATP-binding/permease protein MsbA n=1 Tax=Paenibacillus baekrokdamisoli TaxID=1712516 RepID=A0A3G9JFH8_9BACL|nr:ABC transporter ATP-binding protein [Paenibacillus baekrokdamisoli]MBB3068908.1 subfamily B ATP-binding cassette protein MsbA [Paenibacillus baekrokdamisoli]BBH23733.1 lipid A export ATP-binding/permease protein MsbA [Paenibacillus baekrokdamisoli]
MTRQTPLVRLLTYMSRYKMLYVGLIITMVVGTVLELSIAWFLSLITNAAVKHEVESWPNLVLLAVGMLICIGLHAYFDTYLKQKASLKVRNDIRLDTLDHVLCLPQSYYDKNHSGELLARFTSDNQAVGEASGNIIMGLLKNPLLALCAFIYLLNIHWPLALISISIGPLMIVFGKLFGEVMRKKSIRLQEAMGTATTFLQDVLGASILYKIFGLEKKISKQYQRYSTEISEIERSQGKIQGTANAVSGGIASLTFIIAILVAGFFVAKGNLEVGAMLAFIQLMNYLVQPFSQLPGLWSSMQQALAGAERIFQIIDAPREYEKLPEEGRAKTSFSELAVSTVGFSYTNSEEDLSLRDVHFRVNAGQTIAIVGTSGGGKSTLFKLLLGLYSPTQGMIEIDGRSKESMGLREYRSYFSLVPQETVLFTGTIRDNILDGNPMADEASVIAAAKKANAYDFIMKLSEGFDTEIGERGSRLSGGQKQRIAIARAILRDAPILLLDEATSALDNESERIVQDALAELMVGRTTLVIAHRLTTIQNADLILVMENGNLVEQGTHNDLLQVGGRYHSLYYAQLEEKESTLLMAT